MLPRQRWKMWTVATHLIVFSTPPAEPSILSTLFRKYWDITNDNIVNWCIRMRHNLSKNFKKSHSDIRLCKSGGGSVLAAAHQAWLLQSALSTQVHTQHIDQRLETSTFTFAYRPLHLEHASCATVQRFCAMEMCMCMIMATLCNVAGTWYKCCKRYNDKWQTVSPT